MSIVIRRAEEEDIPAIVSLWDDFMELLGRTNRDYWQLKDGKPAFARYLQSTINEADVMVSVADREGVGVIGFALARIETLPEWFGSEQIGLIRYLAISEKERGLGIGVKMVEFLFDWFQSFGVKRVELYVLNNLPSSGFWTRIGFKEFLDRRFMDI